jgi:membrane peptidoglycan carboxypeptidase
VLRGVVDGGTGSRAQLLGRPVAGKTGTTDDNKSALFVGYTPQLSTAVALFGEDDSDPASPRMTTLFGLGGTGRVNGGAFPTQIWTDFMGRVLRGRPILGFQAPQPIGVIQNQVVPPPQNWRRSPTGDEQIDPNQSPAPGEENPELGGTGGGIGGGLVQPSPSCSGLLCLKPPPRVPQPLPGVASNATRQSPRPGVFGGSTPPPAGSVTGPFGEVR